LTTHRIIFTKGNMGLEIPHHYIRKWDVGGGMFSTQKVEIYLDPGRLNAFSPHVVEHWIKEKQAKQPPHF